MTTLCSIQKMHRIEMQGQFNPKNCVCVCVCMHAYVYSLPARPVMSSLGRCLAFRTTTLSLWETGWYERDTSSSPRLTHCKTQQPSSVHQYISIIRAVSHLPCFLFGTTSWMCNGRYKHVPNAKKMLFIWEPIKFPLCKCAVLPLLQTCLHPANKASHL